MPWPKGKPFPKEMVEKRCASFVANGKKRKKPLLVGEVEHWQCSTCNEWFPAEKYYARERASNGLSTECRSCHCKTSIRTRNAEVHRDARKESARRKRAENPELIRAKEREASRRRGRSDNDKVRDITNRAVNKGVLPRPTVCTECGEKKKITAHHPDYSKPLEVEWLCYECHGKRHRKI